MFDYIKYIPYLCSVNNEHSKQTQSIHLLIEYIMIAIVNNNAVVINNSASRRANVIAKRTNSDVMGVVKAQMIDVLKAKLQSGIAHFLFLKKDGSLRELLAMCTLSTFYFGNEGGTRHMVQALGIPSYAIYSPAADKRVWLPANSVPAYGIGVDYSLRIRKYSKLFATITPDIVCDELFPLLDKYCK